MSFTAAIAESRTLLHQLEQAMLRVRREHDSLVGKTRNPHAECVMDAVCWFYGDLTPVQIMGRSRRDRIVWARQVAMALTRETGRLSLHVAGEIFGRDHGTILHAIHRVSDLTETDANKRAEVAAIRRRIGESKVLKNGHGKD